MPQPTHSQPLITPSRRTWGLAVGLLSVGAGWAQSTTPPTRETTSPYFIGAGLGLTYDSNVTRVSSNPQSDTSTTSTLLAGINQTLSRQRIYLDANIANNRYQEFKSLNNTSYGLNTGINWETIGSLSGNVRYGLSQNLANPALAGAPSSLRNSQKTQLVGTSARYGMNSRVALEAGIQHRQVDYSLPSFSSLENTQNVANVGVVFGLRGLLTVGLGARSTETDRPRYNALGSDEAQRKDIDLTLGWSPSGRSTINGRISASKEDHSRATASDFSGVTGNLSWDFQPFGRLRFNTTFNRDTGSESRFLDFASTPDKASGKEVSTPTDTEIYRLTHTLQGSATYLVTSKITSTAFLSRSRGSLVGNGVNTSFGRDNVTTYGVAATYLATRSLSLTCRVNHEARSTNSNLSSSYTANTLACLGNVYLR